MKITETREVITFSKLDQGDVFRCDTDILMKIEDGQDCAENNSNAVFLTNGELTFIEECQLITKLDAELKIK